MAVISRSSDPKYSRPTLVPPKPMPVPSESMIVVLATPELIVPLKATSAVIETVLPPVLILAPLAVVKVPPPVSFVSASTVSVPEVAANASLSVTPLLASSVNAPAPVMPPVVASKVRLPAEVRVTPEAN